MAQTSTIGLYDQGFARWLEGRVKRNAGRLTGHVSEYWDRRTTRRARQNVWRIDERALLRAEIDPGERARLRLAGQRGRGRAACAG